MKFKSQPTIDKKNSVMSHDLRRRLAYFGPREKVYPDGHTEIEGLPQNWRRVLGMSYPSPVVGPFGCVYADMEHAICAYRYLYTSNRPVYGQMFRAEVPRFAGSSMCRRWGSANGMSLLLTDPNDRIWFLVRDRCMFDVVFQRISRDEVYRLILTSLVDAQYTPVYHVRTANEATYWGATMNRELQTNTMYDRSPRQEDMETLYDEAEKYMYREGRDMLVGDNRLGQIMVEALFAYRKLQSDGGIGTTRVHGLVHNDLKRPLTPLGAHIVTAAQQELAEEEAGQKLPPTKKSRKVCSKDMKKKAKKKAAAAMKEEDDDDETESAMSVETTAAKPPLPPPSKTVTRQETEDEEEEDPDDILEQLWAEVNTAPGQVDEEVIDEILNGVDEDPKLYTLF